MEKTENKYEMILPLFEGKIICGTCHNPHQKGILKGAAAIGADAEKRLRLEEGKICSACHVDKVE